MCKVNAWWMECKRTKNKDDKSSIKLKKRILRNLSIYNIKQTFNVICLKLVSIVTCVWGGKGNTENATYLLAS